MDNNQTVTVEMTVEERAELEALRAERAAKLAAAKAAEDREAYKALGEELVAKYVPELAELSKRMYDLKRRVFEDFAELIRTKEQLYGLKPGQRSHSYRDAQSSRRITLGYHHRDGWDDTVDAGILKVKEYISSRANTEDTKDLVSIILDLLSKDAQGNLQADKVLQLEKYAKESGDRLFREGVEIIKEAYRPEISKQYIRAEIKTSDNAWRIIPLGITEVGNVVLEQQPTE